MFGFVEALLTQKDQDLRQRVIQMFVHKIEILPESYRLHYYVGKSHLERFKDNKNKSENGKSVAQKAIDGPDASALSHSEVDPISSSVETFLAALNVLAHLIDLIRGHFIDSEEPKKVPAECRPRDWST